MSGQPLRKPNDATRFFDDYMKVINLQSSINDMNLQANKTYKATGQLPPQSQMPDTRTPEEKLKDITGLKTMIIKEISKISSQTFGQAVVNEIEKSPLNGGNALLQFVAQRIPEIIEKLKQNYILGIKGDVNDAIQFVKLQEDIFNKTAKGFQTITSYFNRPTTDISESIRSGDIPALINSFRTTLMDYAPILSNSPELVRLFQSLITRLNDIQKIEEDLSNLTEGDRLDTLQRWIEDNNAFWIYALRGAQSKSPFAILNTWGSPADLYVEITNILEDLPNVSSFQGVLEHIKSSIKRGNLDAAKISLQKLIEQLPEPSNLRRMMVNYVGGLRSIIEFVDTYRLEPSVGTMSDAQTTSELLSILNSIAGLQVLPESSLPAGTISPPIGTLDTPVSQPLPPRPVRPNVDVGMPTLSESVSIKLPKQILPMITNKQLLNIITTKLQGEDKQKSIRIVKQLDETIMPRYEELLRTNEDVRNRITRYNDIIGRNELPPDQIDELRVILENLIRFNEQQTEEIGFIEDRIDEIKSELIAIIEPIMQETVIQTSESPTGDTRPLKPMIPSPSIFQPSQIGSKTPTNEFSQIVNSLTDGELQLVLDKINEKIVSLPPSEFKSSIKEKLREVNEEQIAIDPILIAGVIKELKDADNYISGEYGIKGLGVKRLRGRPKGSVMPKVPFQAKIATGEGIKSGPRFTPFGKYVLDKNNLMQDVITIKSMKGGNIIGFPNKKVSRKLGDVFRKMSGGMIPSFDDMASLDEEEKKYLHSVAKKSNLLDKISVPTPNKDERERDLHQFEVMKGEIMSGNDNKEFIKKFKILLMKLQKNNELPKREVNEILGDLAELGY